MKTITLLTCTLLLNLTFSQTNIIRGPIGNPSAGVLDAFYTGENIPTKKVTSYEHIREADVMWSKRVWRVIDLREKFNHPLYYPLDEIDIGNGIWFRNETAWSLWTIFRYHIMSGDLTLYSPYHPIAYNQWDGDGFKYPIVSEKPSGNFYNDSLFRLKLVEYLAMLGPETDIPLSSVIDGSDSVIFIDGVWVTQYVPRDTFYYTSGDIVAYKLKEDWFFDKERSVMDCRIIGIAPMRYSRDRNTNAIVGMHEMFWLYFPECRYVLQNFYVSNRHNDAQRMSFDDLFWKRQFQSYITKESNLYGRDVEDYSAGVHALLESDRIEEEIFSLEHDLWSF